MRSILCEHTSADGQRSQSLIFCSFGRVYFTVRLKNTFIWLDGRCLHHAPLCADLLPLGARTISNGLLGLWMQDKPALQQRLSRDLASLVSTLRAGVALPVPRSENRLGRPDDVGRRDGRRCRRAGHATTAGSYVSYDSPADRHR